MKVFYQLSTHWDREWYKPFQGFRYYLVEMMDNLIESLENGELDTFSFDGQTIVIDDYLEVRSENYNRVKKLISDGKINVGPWYVMPDEIIVSGESLVENFLVGSNTAEKYGTKAWKFGYINDVFGHVAQFPQILNGFGIKGTFLGRGAGHERQFIWKSPDNSECFVFNYNYSRIKREIDECDDKRKYLVDYIEEHDIPVAIVNYTDDHATIGSNTVEFEKLINDLPYEVEEGLEKYACEVAKYYEKLLQKSGELIQTARTMEDFRAVTHSLSSYYPLKQENDKCERLLYNVLAPMIVMGEHYGIKGKRAFFDIARKYLLKNQPHDSICGCSIDDVHKNMPYRYNQAKEITDVTVSDFITRLVPKKTNDGEYFLYAYNFGLTPREGVVTADIDFPREWEKTMYTNTLMRPEYMFKIIDESGEEVKYQLLSERLNSELYNRQEIVPTHKHTVAMNTTLKPFGITRFKVVPCDSLNREAEYTHPGVLKAENEYIILDISPTGDISVTNKATGKKYSGLNTFYDDSDAGNGWFHETSGIGTQSTVASGGSVEVLNRGSLVNRFRITTYMNVPSKGNRYELVRSDDYTKITIKTIVTLRAKSKMVEFETEIENTANDHRLRVIFPSEIKGENYITSQAFAFIERKRGVSDIGINARETESYEKNTSGIIGVDDGKDCLYFVGKEGFHEGGVYPDGTISVTMFRAFGHAFEQPKTVEAQLNRKMSFTYALSFDENGLWSKQRLIADKPYTSFVKTSSDAEFESLISLDNENIVLSVLKPAERADGYILRLFNPTGKEQCGKLAVNMNVTEIYEATLEENLADKTDLKNNSVDIVIEPYKIATYYLNK